MGMYDSEGKYYAGAGETAFNDPATQARYLAIWNGPGTVDQKLALIAQDGPGNSGAVEWATLNGFDVSNTGVGRAHQQAMADASEKGTGALREGIKATTLGGAAVLGGMAAAPYLGAGAAAPAVGDAGAVTGVASAGGASGGALMPAAVAESAAGLAEMGLTQVAPGVWSAGGAVGGAGLSGLGSAGAEVAGTAAADAGVDMGIYNTYGNPYTMGAPSLTPAQLGIAGTGVGTGTAAATGGLGSFLSNPAVLGAAGGALLGSGILGGGTEAGTIQVEEGLPDWLMPYAKPALDNYATDLQNYQIDPYGIMPSAMKEFQNTVSGMYLDPSRNKYLEDYFRAGSERVKGALSPSFGHMQAFGSHTGYNEALSKGLGDLATGLYGGAYEKERNRQTQMTAGAPQFLAQSSTAAFSPYQQYLQTVGSLGKKKDEPYFTNPMGNLFGGALAGAGLGSLWK